MNLQVSRILHAGYLFEFKGTRLLFDPLFENPFSVNCHAFPPAQFDLTALKQLEIHGVFISHYHDDHFSLESLNHLSREVPIFMFTVFPELLDLVRRLGFKNVHSLQLNQSLTLGEFQVTALEALDADVDCVLHIQAGEIHVLNVVDSWIGFQTMQKLKSIPRWDLVLWPFQTMREIEAIAPSTAPKIATETTQLPSEWLEQLIELKPQAIVPSSCQFQFEDWSWYNQIFFPISYDQFFKQVHEVLPQTQILRLDPSESLAASSAGLTRSDDIPWIHVQSKKKLDYTFNPYTKPTPVAEIARKIGALSPGQKDQVKEYCQAQILERFLQLESANENPVDPWIWQLITYDDTGTASQYCYKINNQNIHSLQQEASPDWKTEICEKKLWSALHDGESLTSLYIRIAPAKNEDPMMDPLLRCLYDGQVGSYQKAQLQRILSQQN